MFKSHVRKMVSVLEKLIIELCGLVLQCSGMYCKVYVRCFYDTLSSLSVYSVELLKPTKKKQKAVSKEICPQEHCKRRGKKLAACNGLLQHLQPVVPLYLHGLD